MTIAPLSLVISCQEDLHGQPPKIWGRGASPAWADLNHPVCAAALPAERTGLEFHRAGVPGTRCRFFADANKDELRNGELNALRAHTDKHQFGDGILYGLFANADKDKLRDGEFNALRAHADKHQFGNGMLDGLFADADKNELRDGELNVLRTHADKDELRGGELNALRAHADKHQFGNGIVYGLVADADKDELGDGELIRACLGTSPPGPKHGYACGQRDQPGQICQ